MATLSHETLQYIINHVILPPRLPQEADVQTVSRHAEQELLRLVVDQVNAYDAKSSSGTCEQWGVIEKMLEQWVTLKSTDLMSSHTLEKGFAEMRETGEL